jgi:hypothetical protein
MMFKDKKLSIKELKAFIPPLIIGLLSLIFYLRFQAISYDDWDSIQFALGIKDFDLALHQPHSPGYPVYIFILRIINILTQDTLRSMTFLSAISGAIGVFLFYFLILQLFKPKKYIAAIGALLLAFFPLYAVNSLKALSDVFATALYIGWLIIFIRLYRETSKKDYETKPQVKKLIFVLGLLSGISAGVRIQIITAMIIPLGILYFTFWKKKQTKLITSLTVSGLITTLLWMIPVIIDSGGVVEFINLMMGRYLWRYKIHAHTPFEHGFSIPYFIEHAIAHVYNLVRGGLGISLPYQQFGTSQKTFYTLTMLAFLLIMGPMIYHLTSNDKKEKARIFLISGVPYAIFMYMNLTYENPRYWLPLIPFLTLYFIWLALKLQEKISLKNLALIVLLVPLVFFGFKSYTLSNIIHTELPAPAKAVKYIQDKYGEQDTVFLNCSHMNLRHLQYLTEKEMPFYDDYSQDEIIKLVKDNPDLDLISCQCYNTAEKLTQFEQVETISFYRDLRAHWKHNYIEICRFIRK